jgi:hypothetical protein
MYINFYETDTNQIATKSSRGRAHFPYRKKIASLENYEYTLSYGENFYTLSSVIFGTDKFWWVIDDINKPKDVFSYDVGDDFNVTECAIIPDVVFHVVELYVEPLDEEQEDAA